MKKEYIAPFVIVEDVEIESQFMDFSHVEVDVIGEGDTAPEIKNETDENEDGDGLNSKHGGGFNWGWGRIWED